MTPEAEVLRTFEARAGSQLRKKHLPLILGRATDARNVRRAAAFEGLDEQGLRVAAEAVRAHTIANLDRYLDRFASNAEARGTKVFFAADAGEAAEYVRRVVRDRGATLVAKSKSMASEEIGLSELLGRDGVRAVETDLGEYIVQIAGEAPSHIIAPAVHKTRGDVAALFSRVHGRAFGPDTPAEELTAFARGVLRETFLTAGVGVSGVNFAIAETGSFCLVTNEGNGRMVTSMPPVHVAIMGMERIVPSHRELGLMLPLLVSSATGARVSTYFSFINGPRRPEEVDGPEEVHVVVLDNGRSDILAGEFRSILHCIRCGACQNVCPVYRQVGGHGYGSVYGGPIGAVLTPLLVGFDRAGDLPGASSLCGACAEVCPVRIPLVDHLIGLRREVAQRKPAPAERAAFLAWSLAWSGASRYRLLARALRPAQALLARGGRIRWAPYPLSRWTRGRDLPALAPETFRDRWRRRQR